MNYEEYYKCLQELQRYKKNKMRIPHNMTDEEFFTRIEHLENAIREYNKNQRN